MPSRETARLVILDPSPLYYHAVQAALARAYGAILVHAVDASSARQALDRSLSTLVLIGPSWTPPEALRLCRALGKHSPAPKIVIVSAVAGELLFQTDAAYSGASACLDAAVDAKTLTNALAQVQRGATLFAPEILRAAHHLPKLTSREVELLRVLAQDKCDREIADELCVSEHTVGAHLRSIFRKLQVHDRREAVRRARHRGWV